MTIAELDVRHMSAPSSWRSGEGFVEPNPMVGCVIAQGEPVIAEGWHRRFGGPHAEIEALRPPGLRPAAQRCTSPSNRAATSGKRPPARKPFWPPGSRKVVVAQPDPFPAVAGGGIRQLQQAGVAVTTGVLAEQAGRLNAPYRKLITHGRPWVLAKWAMTLGRQAGDAWRRQPLDFQRLVAGRRAPVARTNGWDPGGTRHGSPR